MCENILSIKQEHFKVSLNTMSNAVARQVKYIDTISCYATIRVIMELMDGRMLSWLQGF